MTTHKHRAPEGGRPVSEMQERIARALCERNCIRPWDEQPKAVRESFWADAIAAMKAMREPTPEMKQAIAHADWTGSKDMSWSDGFTLMIDREISIAEGGKDDL